MDTKIIEKAIAQFYPTLKGKEIKSIGRGSFATAYRVGDLVFKVTTDEDDAMASLRVKGAKLEHIVGVDNVFKVGKEKYLIISDYVPIEMHEETKYEGLMYHIDDIAVEIRRHIMYEQPLYELDFEQFGLDGDVIAEIYAFIMELSNYGFTSADFHEYNVKVGADGKFKMFDLGFKTSSYTDISSILIEELI